jgi:hypothetical protein
MYEGPIGIAWLVCGVVAFVLAHAMYRGPDGSLTNSQNLFGELILSLLLGPLMLAFVGVHYAIGGGTKKCPACRMSVPRKAQVCHHCGYQFVRRGQGKWQRPN